MKKTIMALLFFGTLGCAIAKSDNLMRQEGNQKAICEFIYCYIKNIAIKEHYRKIQPNMNLTFEGLLIVASFNNDLSDQYLLKFLDFYIGSAPGAYLDDLIMKRGKKVLPALYHSKGKRTICDQELYKCGNHIVRVTELIDLIYKQKEPNLTVDNVGDPFNYIPQEEILVHFNIFQSKSNISSNELSCSNAAPSRINGIRL